MAGYLDQQTQLQKMQDASNDMLEASQEQYVAALQKKYNQFLKNITAEAQALRSNIQDANGITRAPTYSEYLHFQGEYKLTAQLQAQLLELNQNVNTDLLDNLADIYRDSYNLNAWSLDEATPPNLDISYTMPPDLVIKQLVAQDWDGTLFSQRLGAINDMMARDIQGAVAQSMLSGDSTRELGARIANIIGDGSSGYTYRANMIATTELLRSANVAREAVLTENDDVIEDWIWVSRSLASGRLCEDCAERAGKGYDEVKEIAEGQELPFNMPVHPWCGCTWMPKVKEWQDLLPAGVRPVGTLGPTTMSYPSETGLQSKVVPMNYADWADRYLSEHERGDL